METCHSHELVIASGCEFFVCVPEHGDLKKQIANSASLDLAVCFFVMLLQHVGLMAQWGCGGMLHGPRYAYVCRPSRNRGLATLWTNPDGSHESKPLQKPLRWNWYARTRCVPKSLSSHSVVDDRKFGYQGRMGVKLFARRGNVTCGSRTIRISDNAPGRRIMIVLVSLFFLICQVYQVLGPSNSLRSLVAERQTCNLKVLGSIPSEGLSIFDQSNTSLVTNDMSSPRK